MANINYKMLKDRNYEFVNPYVFVPIDYSSKSKPNNEVEKNLTGRISCRIKTKTPLAIPDFDKMKSDGSYPFMKIKDNYTIPGSSIRGMIRSIYETATNSCFATADEAQFLSSRVGSRYPYKPALLKKNKETGEWMLFKCERIMLHTECPESKTCPGKKYTVCTDNKDGRKYIVIDNKKIYGGELVSCSVGKDYFIKGKHQQDYAKEVFLNESKNNNTQGYLVLGEKIYNKHHESIFKQKEQIKGFSSDKIKHALNALKSSLEIYRNSSINNKYPKQHTGYPNFEFMEKNGHIPVWYKLENGNPYFSLASIGRRAFSKTMPELLGKKKPCASANDICKACSLFGTVNLNDKAKKAIASRVRFSDAVCLTPDKISESSYVTLAELSSPKPSYMDFYVMKSKFSTENSSNLNYDSNGALLAGRKFYWQTDNFKKLNTNIGKTDRNATMQIASDGAEFVFDIFFDNISNEELNELVWSINFFENDINGKLCHKIGHGKPIGLGSSKIIVENISVRKFENNCYTVSDYDIDYSVAPVSGNTVNALLQVSEFRRGLPVRYPYIAVNSAIEQKIKSGDTSNNNIASHQWFTQNKETKSPQKLPSLPLKTDIIPRLYPLIHDSKENMPVGIHPASVVELDFEKGNGTFKNNNNRNNNFKRK